MVARTSHAVACAIWPLVAACARQPDAGSSPAAAPPWGAAAPAAARAAGVPAAPRGEAEQESADAGSSCEPVRIEVEPPLPGPIEAPVPQLVGGETVAAFYERLAARVRGRRGAVRIGFYGDSNLTLDGISGALRRALQARFGDAGHGYVGVGNPFRGYRHRDVRRQMVGHWKTYLYSHHDRGEGFGAGGMAAATGEPHARALFRTAADDAPVGRSASRFSVFYLLYPEGGRLSISVDGEPQAVVDTAAESAALGVRTVSVPDGPHRFEVRNLGRRWIRLFGVTLERDEPGVIVDAFGVTGTTYYHLARMDEPVSRAMLAERGYDLLLFLVGTNFWRFEDNPQAAGRVIAMHRAVHPGLPIVIMSPPDHVRFAHSAHSDPRVVAVTDQLRAIARAEKCAFWDFREAMGGDASMRTFYHRGLAGEDLYHLTERGAELMGRRLAFALVRGLADHVAAHPRAGCEPGD